MASDKAVVFPAWYLLLTVPVVALVVASAWWGCRPNLAAPPAAAVPPPRKKIVGEAVKPEPRPAGYVGSEACTKCHSDIAEKYAGHSMYRSAGMTPGKDDVENFDERTEFNFADGRVYRVEKRPDGIYHHEALYDNDGELIYDEAAKVSIFIGSGTRGKSYAIDHGGVLVQSPISWYTSEHKWDISPGYSFRHVRFGRRIPYECIDCHAGRPTHDPDRENYFPEPVLIEAAIGCERCHGPGQKHIEYREADELAGGEDPIVNPSKLDPDRREATCYQCHLIGEKRYPRYGRTFGDFRPGDRLDDVWATMVKGTGVRGDRKTKAVSHVEQMRESTCFAKSEGRFGCTSCHDAHSSPAHEEVEAYYQQRCLNCHSEKGCSLPAEQQAAAPANNSCTYCHMPKLTAHDIAHASQTDHRILRKPEANEGIGPAGGQTDAVVLFDEENTVMPPWEVERALAFAQVRKLRQSGYASRTVAEELMQTLSMLVEIAPDDPPIWIALGDVADLRHDNASARKNWERALKLWPDDEMVLDSLAVVCQQSGDYQASLDYSNRLIDLEPWRARDYERRSAVLAHFGRLREAIADAEKAVELEPLDKKARRWLKDLYRQVGNFAAGSKQDEILKRIADLPIPPG
jgi:predicted CXXCH cytochrome family protein